VRVSRFVLIGGLCAGLSNVFVISFERHHFGHLAAAFLAFGPVLIVGYTLHAGFTFGVPASLPSFIRYALAMAANFPIWIAALYVLCDLFDVSIVIAAPATTVLIFLWNYTSTRWALLAAARAAHPNVRAGD
jgi:putative flippase GtrA